MRPPPRTETRAVLGRLWHLGGIWLLPIRPRYTNHIRAVTRFGEQLANRRHEYHLHLHRSQRRVCWRSRTASVFLGRAELALRRQFGVVAEKLEGHADGEMDFCRHLFVVFVKSVSRWHHADNALWAANAAFCGRERN